MRGGFAVVSERGSILGGSRAPVELARALARLAPTSFFARNIDPDTRQVLLDSGVRIHQGSPTELFRWLKKDPPVAVSTHTRAGLLLAARLAHPRVVATYHGTQRGVIAERMFPARPWWLAAADALADALVWSQQFLLWRLPHRAVAISQAAAEELRRRYGRAARAIPWGAAPQGWSDEHAGQSNRKPVLLSVSRFTPYKGFHHLLELHAKLRARFPALRLVLAGATLNQRYREHLKRTAQPGVEFIENPSDETLRALYGSARVYVSFDRFPFFGMTLLESQAAGVPVVALRRLAANELVREGETGFLVDSVGSAADRCALLLADPGLCQRMGSAARAWAGTFTWDRTANRYREVLAT